MKNRYMIVVVLSATAAALAIALGAKTARSDHASEFYHDIDADAHCTYWGQDVTGDDTALCRSHGYLVYCVAGAHAKPVCAAVVNLNPPPAGSGSGK